MKKLTRMEKFGIVAAIVVCGSYFYMKRVYDPEAAALSASVRELNGTIASYNAMKEPPPLELLKDEIKFKTENLERLISKMKDAGGRMGKAAEVTEVLSLITGIAKEQNMQVLKISPEQEVEGKHFTWAAFSITLGGRYRNFYTFVGRLKKRPEPMQLRHLNIERDEEKPGRIIITTTLLI